MECCDGNSIRRKERKKETFTYDTYTIGDKS
jgi:hypothetical protein